jgi:hypothetical protein
MDQPKRGPPKFGALKTKAIVGEKKPSAHELALAPTVAAPAPFKTAAVAAAEVGGIPVLEESAGTVVRGAVAAAAPVTLKIRRKKPVLPTEGVAPAGGVAAAAAPAGGVVAATEGVGSVASASLPTIQRIHPVHKAFKAQKTEEETRDVYLIKRPPPAFVPPTRRGFITFFENTFNETGEAAADFMLPPKKLGQKDLDACKKLGKASAVEAFKYQQFIREYLRGATPYRGLLVYHGLGSGKTCSAIAAAEALYGVSGKKIIIMTPGSLRPNFQAQISFCGFRHYRYANNWKFMSLSASQPYAGSTRNFATTVMGIPEKFLGRIMARAEPRRGIWIPDFKEAPNYETLDALSQTEIRDQILAILEDKIEFINYNGISAARLKEIVCADGNAAGPGHFDNKVIIIDEVHNLSRLMQGQIHGYMEKLATRKRAPDPEPVMPTRWKPRLCAGVKNYKRAFLLYRLIAEARNSKIIALSGTPLINFPDELAPLINMVAGYIHGGRIAVTERTEAAQATVRRILNAHPRVDYVDVKAGQLELEVNFTVFLDGYVKVCESSVVNPAAQGERQADGSCAAPAGAKAPDFKGLRADDTEGLKGADTVAAELIAAIRAARLTVTKDPALISYPVLPTNPKEFNRYFVDESTLEATNVDTLQKRLYGLISYYRGASEDLMPAIVEDKVIQIRFSEYSLQYYTRKRVQEIAEAPDVDAPPEETSPYDDVAGVAEMANPANYRFNSRAACNFAFPASIPRPYQSLKKQEEAAAAAAMDELAEQQVITDEAFEQTDEAAAEVAAAAEEEAAIVAEEVTLMGGGGEEEAAAAAAAPEATAPGQKFLAKAEEEMKAARFEEVPEEEEEGGAAAAARRIEPYQVRLTKALAKLRAEKANFLRLDGPAGNNLEKYSPKFAKMIRTIGDPESVPGTSLVYSQFYTAEGLGIFGYALEANGYTNIEFTSPSGNPFGAQESNLEFTAATKASMARKGDKRFMFFSGEQSVAMRRVTLNLFNGRINELPSKIQEVMRAAGYEELGNKKGEICKVIGITGAGAEGISLKFVRGVHIMEPYWNDVRLEQVKGRAVRICSHAELPPDDRTVSVFTYACAFFPEDLKATPDGKPARVIQTLQLRDHGITSDQKVLQLSDNKKKLNSGFLHLLKETAVDCALNSGENEAGLVCYEGIEGSPKDYASVPDLKKDIEITTIEQRQKKAAGAAAPGGGGGPAAPAKGEELAHRGTFKYRDKSGVEREAFINIKHGGKEDELFAFDITDVKKRKDPVARVLVDAVTGDMSAEFL